MTQKNLNKEIERECAELAINKFLDDNFVYGRWTFTSVRWVSNNTVRIVDRDGKKAKVRYDIETDTVTLN